MTSYELKDNLDSFERNIDSKIRAYNDLLTTANDISNEINVIKGTDTSMYDGIINNNESIKETLTSIIDELESVKASVHSKTTDEIKRLKDEENKAINNNKKNDDNQEEEEKIVLKPKNKKGVAYEEW